MAYRADKDLEFLAKVSAEDMKPLTEVLTKSFNQNLDKRDPSDPAYWTYVAEQIQLYGGDTLVNTLFRFGDGVPYREVLTDVCDRCKVKYDKKKDIVADIEKKLVNKIFIDAWDKLSADDKRAVLANAKIPYTPNMLGANGGLVVSSMLYAGSQFGYFLMRDFIYSVLIGIVGQASLTFTISRAITIWAGPIGVLLSGIWAFSGTAYRVTIPACLMVAMLRKQAGLTPEEIIKRDTQAAREREIKVWAATRIHEEKKLIYMYLFCWKIFEQKKVEAMYADMLKAWLFGQTKILESNNAMVEEHINLETFSSIIKKNLHLGNQKEELYVVLKYWLGLIENGITELNIKIPSDAASDALIFSEFDKMTA